MLELVAGVDVTEVVGADVLDDFAGERQLMSRDAIGI